MVVVDSVKKLENKIEKSIKDAYKSGDYIRCYNLMKLMAKVNKNNPTLLYYVTKIDEKQVEKTRTKWALWWNSYIISLLKSPKLYVAFFFLVILGRIK